VVVTIVGCDGLPVDPVDPVDPVSVVDVVPVETKVTLAFTAPVTVRLQVAALPEQFPPHDPIFMPDDGFAVSVTAVPEVTDVWQVPGQLMPLPVTVPPVGELTVTWKL
jgi:hypothetical protein